MCVRDEAVRGRVAWEQGTAGTAGTEGNSKSYSPVLGFPKTTFRFDDSFRRTHKTQKSIILLYYSHSGRIHVKMNKGKKHRGQSPGETRYKISVVFTQRSQLDSTQFSQQ